MSGPGPATQSPQAIGRFARVRSAELARECAEQVAEAIRYVSPGLTAIRERARTGARQSARVRALPLEFLPDVSYLAHRLAELRFELRAISSRRFWPPGVHERIDELETAFDRAIQLCTTIDVAGELDLPFDLAVAVQAGARTGISALQELRDAVDAARSGRLDTADRPAAPIRSAQWLVHAAGRLLPAAARERYLEEFTGELLELTRSGVGRRGQLAHALRLAVRIWSLRAALPTDARPTAADRVHVLSPGRAPRPARHRAPTWRRTAFGRWVARQESRRLALRTVRRINRSTWQPAAEPMVRRARGSRGYEGRHRRV